jgi:RHS repeat-associated protein
VNGQYFTLNNDAENRLVSVTGASTANFYYDADGAQVKTIVNGVTTYYVGNHYELKGTTVTKYYFAGATRLAVRTNGTLSYLLGDHIGSSSVTTDANGVKTASALYKAFGETRFSAGNLGTDYKFTGQREEASLGIYYFNARWMDPSLGRFTSPDSIVPTSTQGTQAWDRYAFVNNNPVRYNDPTGHWAIGNEPTHIDNTTAGPVCMDPKATNYRAEGTCDYPVPDVTGTYYVTFYITTAADAGNVNLSTKAEESYVYGPDASLGWPDAVSNGSSTYSDFNPDIPYYPISLRASVTSGEGGTIVNDLSATNGTPTYLQINRVNFNGNFMVYGPSTAAGTNGTINMPLNYHVPSGGVAMQVMMISHGGAPKRLFNK